MKRKRRQRNGAGDHPQGTNSAVLTVEAMVARLSGHGPMEVTIEAGSPRFRVPGPYIDAEIGFPELLVQPWIIAFRAPRILIATPKQLWSQHSAALQHELVEANRVTLATFQRMYLQTASFLRMDKWQRWQMPAHLYALLKLGASERTLVLRPSGPGIEILPKHIFESEQAKDEAEIARALESHGKPGETTARENKPSQDHSQSRASGSRLVA